jgi:hypothetical protein
VHGLVKWHGCTIIIVVHLSLLVQRRACETVESTRANKGTGWAKCEELGRGCGKEFVGTDDV